MVERISFQDQIASNKLKSAVLVSIIIVFFIVLGYLVSWFFDPLLFYPIMIISIIISLSYTLISYYNSDKLALASVNAKPASQTQHRMFFQVAENMALASGLPMPRLYVMESGEINAFASGRDPRHAVICVTTGALQKLNKQELEGVIAHEMSHVANYDIRFMTLAAVLIGMVSIVAELFLRNMWMTGHNDDRGKNNGALIVIGLLFSILAPIAAQLVALAISRRREYLADATGVKLTRYPPGLASALRKIKGEHITKDDVRNFNKATAPLFISNPFKNVGALFATHPPIDERIRRLEAM